MHIECWLMFLSPQSHRMPGPEHQVGGCAALALAFACGLAGAAHAQGDGALTKQKCIDSYANAQKLRRDGRLRAARAELMNCAQERCPSAARDDCSRWLNEVEAAQPTIVIVAKGDAGEDVADVRVVIDGDTTIDHLDKAIPIDPGEHTLRFTRNARVFDQKLVVREGEKMRSVLVSFAVGADSAGSAAAAASARFGSHKRAIPTASYVLGGVGLAALAGFGAFALSGYSKERSLRDSPCAATSTCSTAETDSVKKRYLIGDVLLGVGVASIGAAIVVYFVQPRTTRPEAAAGLPFRSLDLQPVTGGGVATVGGAF